MTSEAQNLHELDLLTWKTAAVGFQRGWLDVESVEELAVQAMVQATNADSELATLCSVGQLSRYEIEDLLGVLVERFDPNTDEETAMKCWCLSRLIGLSRESMDDEQLFDRMAELNAEFGHPKEIECVSRYYFTPDERAAGIDSNKRYAGASESLELAVANLRAVLMNPTG